MTRTRQTKGLQRLGILGLRACFCAIGNKNAGNAQQNARHA